KGLFNFRGNRTPEAVQSQPEGDIVINAHCKRVWLLEHHTDKAAHCYGIDSRVIDVPACEVNMSREPESAHYIVHPVKTAKNRTLAAPGGPYESGYFVFLDRDMGIAHCFERAVVKLLDIAVYDRAVGRTRIMKRIG